MNMNVSQRNIHVALTGGGIPLYLVMQLGCPILKIRSLYSQMKLTEKGMQNSTILSGIIFFKFVGTKSNI